MTIKIESGVPLPDSPRTGITAALRKLKVGQSFVITKEQRANISGTAQRLGVKVVTRTVDGVTRLWRVE